MSYSSLEDFILSYLLVSLLLYFFPFIISIFTRNRTASVFVMNLFLGWTVIGWVWALVWSITPNNDKSDITLLSKSLGNSSPNEQPDKQSSLLNQLSQLHDLYEKGVLTQEIYEQQKEKLVSELEKKSKTQNLNANRASENDMKYKELFESTSWLEKNSANLVTTGIIIAILITLYFVFLY